MGTLFRGYAASTLALALLSACGEPKPPIDPPNIVNDVTRLNPVEVDRIVVPASAADVSRFVAAHDGAISIGGGRYSQGGQTACGGCLFIDMREMDAVLDIDPGAHTIRVEAGITWRQIQEAIDGLDLSPKIMQSYSNFTVGGSLSVNCHGDYVGLGPIVESVREIRLVLADGEIVTASRQENRDLFEAAIGGYGGIGVIVEATLDLADNSRLERVTEHMDVEAYPAWREANVASNPDAVLHHALIYPPAYERVAAELSSLTDKPVTIKSRLPPTDRPSGLWLVLLDIATHTDAGKAIRESVYDPLTSGSTQVVWRNYEAAQDVNSLEPASREKSTYVLQEYFVPVEAYAPFLGDMRSILTSSNANVLNVAIRHTRADRETLLSWAREDVFSFVLYYEQGTEEAARREVAEWTSRLIDAAIKNGGAYYLPYQIVATREQFLAAYPRAHEFFAIKKRVDPGYKFRNRLWEAYYSPPE